jgi:3-dehydroquinate dehydratase
MSNYRPHSFAPPPPNWRSGRRRAWWERSRLAAAKLRAGGDIVEVRLDKMARPSDWLKRCAALQSGGKPVLLTVRLRAEGGDWETDDEQRLEIYNKACRNWPPSMWN